MRTVHHSPPVVSTGSHWPRPSWSRLPNGTKNTTPSTEPSASRMKRMVLSSTEIFPTPGNLSIPANMMRKTVRCMRTCCSGCAIATHVVSPDNEQAAGLQRSPVKGLGLQHLGRCGHDRCTTRVICR
eukprot:365693-Chlamydomonas_euryale.AAC.6